MYVLRLCYDVYLVMKDCTCENMHVCVTRATVMVKCRAKHSVDSGWIDTQAGRQTDKQADS